MQRLEAGNRNRDTSLPKQLFEVSTTMYNSKDQYVLALYPVDDQILPNGEAARPDPQIFISRTS